MCDTFVTNKNNKKYFFKNSDRSPNEINFPIYYPHSKPTDDKLRQFTYISIDDEKESNAVILIKPTWIWGAEMGVNEYGVCIGNEAVFTKTQSKKPKLIGMDFLRLGLEKGKTAKEALDIIINYLEKYGQGGNCGYDHKFYYDNSYLIADFNESYVLETAGKYYAYKKVENYNISNRLTLGADYDESNVSNNKNFKETFSDSFYTKFSCSKTRMEDGCKLNTDSKSSLENCLKILTYHHSKKAIKNGDTASVCMHKNKVGDHSTGSCIVDLNHAFPIILIGGDTPCISIYKPVVFNDKLDLNETSYWLNQKLLNRLVLGGYIDYQEFKDNIDSINNQIIRKLKSVKEKDDVLAITNYAFKKENELIKKYEGAIKDLKEGKIVLKGIWKNLTSKMPVNIYDRSLKNRLKK